MEQTKKMSGRPDAQVIRQDYEAQIKFDCNYSDEEIRCLTVERGEEWGWGIGRKGNIVTIRPKALVYLPHDKGGRPWGKLDVVDFAIVTFKNLTQGEADALVEPLTLVIEAKIGEEDTISIERSEIMVARGRYMLDIDEALQAKSPITLVDVEKKRKFYARDGYDDVEQPLQNADCCLKYVSDISKTATIQDRIKKMKERLHKENPKRKIVSGRKGTKVKGIKDIRYTKCQKQ